MGMSFGLSLISAMQKEHLSARFAFLDLALSQNHRIWAVWSCKSPFTALINEQDLKKKTKKSRIEWKGKLWAMSSLYVCRVPARASSGILKTYHQWVNKGRQLQKAISNPSPNILAEGNFGKHYLSLPSSKCSSPICSSSHSLEILTCLLFKRLDRKSVV